MSKLVSVIMSTYNEPIKVIQKSLMSILNQTYKDIQLVLINDNPERLELNSFLEKFAQEFPQIKYISNKSNSGLVFSLNKGLENADGEYIARMDADDVSHLDRIEKEVNFLESNNLDLVGCSVNKIDVNDDIIGTIRVPCDNNCIVKFYKYGSCLLHPTWLGKKTVFSSLNGYRNIYACEDYDFVTRCIKKGFKLGNLPEPLLDYRIRQCGISVSNESIQKIMMYYISKNRNRILDVKEEDFEVYIKSKKYKKELNRINKYVFAKNKIKYSKEHIYFFRLLLNKYFYISVIAKLKLNNRDV